MRTLVLLDLDNTLVYSQPARFSWQTTCLPQIQVMPHIWATPRPGLQPFLDWLFHHFDVGVWTAGSGDYANAIVNNFIDIIGSDRRLKFVLTGQNVAHAREIFHGLKHLAYVRENLNIGPYQPVIIIDDHPDVKATNGWSCIQVKPFGPRTFGVGFVSEDQYLEMCVDDELKNVQWQLQKVYM
jgi:hypothetical protein